ncbi:MAG TPA: IPT/TIG domain-containing protein [Candidatus Dormibacteraeota bacterium]|nr:IPT/TIG domain-containing protein [Candidatus Dormibacteraeota bacterium]
MTIADGSVGALTKILDHGPDTLRWNVVVLGDGYQAAELPTFATDAQAFATKLTSTPPFDTLAQAINIYRIDVTSTDSGADDPAACAGGAGTTVNTYFDATFCGGGPPRRELLTIDTALAVSTAKAKVPNTNLTIVIVNSTMFGGSGGAAAVFSREATAVEIALHELGHTAFGLADEYATPSATTGGDSYTGTEPTEPNVTTVTAPATIKWSALLTAGINMPTTKNADCTQVDPQASPVAADNVGAFEGAKYFHCALFRPQFDCRMRTLGTAYCAVCSAEIVNTLQPHMPRLPSISGFSPTTGDPAGGTIVVITGSAFTGATAVNFGANSAVTFNVDADTQITALSPAGTGSVNISITTPDGSTAITLPTQFTYAVAPSPPQITGINPATGTPAGGTSVVITGAGFTGAGAVKFGATAAAAFSVDSDTRITATSPALAAGTVDITVTTPAGTSAASAADQFTFAVPAPTVTSIAPGTGTAAGGTAVVITGTDFAAASSVSFGTATAAFSIDSNTQITAASPAGTGTVDVVVTTPSGASATSAADQFIFQAAAAPTVTAISPTTGAAAGGDTVIITGTGFTGATAVGFGVTGSTNVTVNSDTQITAISPPGTGTVDVTVTTPAGTSATSAADIFAYAAAGAPIVTGINPNTGAGVGGDPVTITGSGFTGATAVNFGGNAATGVTVNSDTQITATSPAGGGTVDVTVTTPAGTSATGPSDLFTYTTAGLPSVFSVNPNTGTSAGGDSVTITGIGFTGATDVGFGAAGAFFNVDSDVQITATTPGGTGSVDVTVTVPAGTSPTSASDVFTYI